MIRPAGWEVWPAIGLLVAAVLLSLIGRRAWCRHLCPTGALLSLAGTLRLFERRVSDACTKCGKCRTACSFGAVRDDFSTRPLECSFCRSCSDACRVDAISYTRRRWGGKASAVDEPALTRRGFVGGCVLGSAAAAGISFAPDASAGLIRPPGALREDVFLDLCVRCGLCMKACPGPVLHPAGLDAGFGALWTPVAVLSWAGCHQECNFRGEVCPTGAIRPLAIERKRRVKMGVARIDTATCVAHCGERDCRLCFDECEAAGYHAIEMREIRLEIGDVPEGVMSDEQIEEASKINAPFINEDACVGCGLCEYRCLNVWTRQREVLNGSAVAVVPAGADRPAR